MAQDASNKRSRKMSKRGKRKEKTQTNDQATYTKREQRTTNVLPKLGADAVDKIPSNAPTMAIAPSDYEHIFHEGPVSPDRRETSPPAPPVATRSPAQQLPATIPRLTTQGPGSPTNFHQQTYQAPYMVGQPPTIAGPMATQNTYNPHQDQDAYTQETAYTERRQNYPPEVLITPDGYNLLGHTPSNRRNPLPPHIVRATNQFSRAALARVSRYLASRAEQPRM